MLRPTALQHYLEEMRLLGYADEQLLANTCIDANALSEPAYLIEQSDYSTFLENMLHLCGDDIGLEIGSRSEVAHYGILAYSGLSAPSIRDGMEEVWSTYGHAFGIMTRLLALSNDAQTTTIEIVAPRLSERLYRFSVEETLCILLRIGATLTHIEAPPFKQVTLSYPEPEYSDRYHELFQCPLEFGTERTSAVIDQQWLDMPLRTRDQELNRICREHLNSVLKQTESTRSTMLRLRHLLLSRTADMPNMEEAAKEFGVSPRTLSRQLLQDGYTYRQLMEEVRKELAQRWLKSTGMTSKEISYRLGFSEVGAFRRAFKTWTGLTVGNYCQAVLGTGRETDNESAD